jgi:hypothetical protein
MRISVEFVAMGRGAADMAREIADIRTASSIQLNVLRNRRLCSSWDGFMVEKKLTDRQDAPARLNRELAE